MCTWIVVCTANVYIACSVILVHAMYMHSPVLCINQVLLTSKSQRWLLCAGVCVCVCVCACVLVCVCVSVCVLQNMYFSKPLRLLGI